MMDEKLGKIHFWGTLIFGNGTFFMMHIVGAGGMQRRISDPTQYESLLQWMPLNRVHDDQRVPAVPMADPVPDQRRQEPQERGEGGRQPVEGQHYLPQWKVLELAA